MSPDTQASSHFSIFARLLAGDAVRDAFYADWAEVASGRLSNGFFHGQLNTTFALHNPEERMRTVLARLLDWPAQSADRPIELDSETLLPRVPREHLKRMSAGWRADEGADAARHCADTDDHVALVNDGADFYAHKNWELAWACWLKASREPSVRAVEALIGPDGRSATTRHLSCVISTLTYS